MVYKSIAKIAGMLAKEGIAKGKKNLQQGYAFRGIDDIYNTISRMLSDEGLVIIPRVISRQFREAMTKTGGVLFYVVVQVEYDFVSAQDGSMHTASLFGEAMDSADKATNKALSAAYKYLCLQTFCIPTEGDNDSDATTHDVGGRLKMPISDTLFNMLIDRIVKGDKPALSKAEQIYTFSPDQQAHIISIM